MVEYKIRADGPGHKGARLVRSEAEVGGGETGTFKGTLLVPSTGYRLQKGDLVMIELATMVDGYFSDLTYMGTVGTPSQRQKETYNHLLQGPAGSGAGVARRQQLRGARQDRSPDTG